MAAAPEELWDALVAACPGPHSSGLPRLWAMVWGAEPARSNGLASHVMGAERPGLLVREVVRPATWSVAGRHRFARYQMVFRIEPTANGASRLHAETYADFPGTSGRLYRLVVIDGGPHALVVRGVLAYLRRRAERRRPHGERV